MPRPKNDSAFTRKPDPAGGTVKHVDGSESDISMRWRKIGPVLYIEWVYPNGSVLSRRKAHDTEYALILRIRELERLVCTKPELRPVNTLPLKRMTNLKRMNV
jgi:hypothetical protein